MIADVLASTSDSADHEATKQLIQAVVTVALFVPIFWGMHRRVKAGTLAPLERRTNPHSRKYRVVLALLNVPIVLFLGGYGVVELIDGDLAFGVTGMLLAGLDAIFVVMLLRQGSALRREGLTDRGPTEAQQKLSKKRRVASRVVGLTTGLILYVTVGAAVDREWAEALVGAVVVAAGFAFIWWAEAPLRRSR